MPSYQPYELMHRELLHNQKQEGTGKQIFSAT